MALYKFLLLLLDDHHHHQIFISLPYPIYKTVHLPVSHKVKKTLKLQL